jgi:hypothetical protein
MQSQLQTLVETIQSEEKYIRTLETSTRRASEYTAIPI